MLKFGNGSGILSFYNDLSKKEYFFFSTFIDNLLALNQLLKLLISLFIFSNKTLRTLCKKKTFVTYIDIAGFSTFEADEQRSQDESLREKQIVSGSSNSFQTILDYSQQHRNILFFLVKCDDQLCQKLWKNQQIHQE